MQRKYKKTNDFIAHLLQLRESGFEVNIIRSLPSQLEGQKQHTCKLVAISNALAMLDQRTVPARKTQRMNGHRLYRYPDSIRAIAKRNNLTQVGEIYNEKTMNEIIDCVSDVESHTKHFEDYQEYVDYIIEKIKQNLSPIVFFDNGEGDIHDLPMIDGKGLREHATVVVGYARDPNTNKLSFINFHHGQFHIFDARQLFLSAKQLEKVRTPEIYFKIKKQTRHYRYSRWLILNKEGEFTDSEFESRFAEQASLTTAEERRNMQHGESREINGYTITKKIGGVPKNKREKSFHLAVMTIEPKKQSIPQAKL